MQFARLNDVTLHYQVIGSPAEQPAVVFVNSLGSDFRIWRDVVVRLAGDCAMLMYDKRGHGLSDVGETPYTMATHAADLEALLQHTGFSGAVAVGSSVGGLIAQQLSLSRPRSLAGIMLLGIAHKVGTAQSWAERIAAVSKGGIDAVADKIVSGWFTAEFRKDKATTAGYRNMLTRTPQDGYLGTVAAIRDTDFTKTARNIKVPVVCAVGDSDPTTPVSLAQEYLELAPTARLEIIVHAGHIPCVEQPDAVAKIIRELISLVGTETHSHVAH
jgi:3-oxoadipate enol-lactonase